jgi:hypothetical protein
MSDQIQIFIRSIGVEELEQTKSAPLLQLKYGSTREVVDILDRPDKIARWLAAFSVTCTNPKPESIPA